MTPQELAISQKLNRLAENYDAVIENVNTGIQTLTESSLESRKFDKENLNNGFGSHFDAIVKNQCILKLILENEKRVIEMLRINQVDDFVGGFEKGVEAFDDKVMKEGGLRGCAEWTEYLKSLDAFSGDVLENEDSELIIGEQVIVCYIFSFY